MAESLDQRKVVTMAAMRAECLAETTALQTAELMAEKKVVPRVGMRAQQKAG